MAGNSGESQLQRIIRDLQDAVTELHREFAEVGEPITDDCVSLHKFSYKLEYLLQFDQKEKSTLLGNRKDYWDYFCDCLAKVKGANDGIRFVKSISELRTSVGKGRAFIRYSLVHQRLADTLQQCFMNTKVTSDWYYARSPFLNSKMSSDIVGHLYELTEVQFDLASRGYDLDAAWPTFARRTLSSFGSSSYLWKPPSRSSSMNSLIQDVPSSPNGNHFLSNEPLDGLEELHVELDRAELQQKELQDRIQHLEKEKQDLQTALGVQKREAQMEREKTRMISEENCRLTKILEQLEKQCEFSHCTQDTIKDLQKCLQMLKENAAEKEQLKELETSKNDCHSELLPLTQEMENTRPLADVKDACVNKLVENQKSEDQNNDLIAKASVLTDEERQQDTSHFESALKTELLEKLHITEREKSDAQKLNEKYLSQLKDLEEQLLLKEKAQEDFEMRMQSFTVDSKVHSSLEVSTSEMATLQAELAEKEKTVADLQGQMKDTLSYVDILEKNVGEERKEREKLEGLFSFTKATTEQEVKNLVEHLEMLETQLSELTETVKSLEEQKKELISEREHFKKTIEGMEKQATEQSSTLKRLQQTNQKLEEKCRKLVRSPFFLEAVVARLQTSEKQLQSQIKDSEVSLDEKEESRLLDENLQNAIRENRVLEETLKILQADYQEQSEETTKESLNLLQTELQGTKDDRLQMEQCLFTSTQHEDTLKLQLMEKDEALRRLENQYRELQGDAEALRKKADALEVAKVSMEKTQVEQVACQQREVKDLASRLALSEEQLYINQAEVVRLQEELIDLQAKLCQASAEQQKLQEQLDVRGSVLGEHKDAAQQLQEQNERLNRNHVQELLEYKEREVMLKNQRDQEAQQKTELEKKLQGLTDELSRVKECLEAVNLENMEVKDLLNRTNTDMAELGIQICTLTTEKVEAEGKLCKAIEELKNANEIAAKEQEKLKCDLLRLDEEKQGLEKELEEFKMAATAVPGLQTQLELAEKQHQSLEETSKEELSALKFQLSTEIINHQTKLKAVSEECDKLKQEVEEWSRQAHASEEMLRELQAAKRDLCVKLDLAEGQLTEYKTAQKKKEEEVVHLKEDLERAQKEVSKVNEQIQDYSEKLIKMKSERENNERKLLAELDDLTRTKQFLEERLIELLRDKDALWQKSDALEFQQKLSAEQRWLGDAEVSCCLDCKREFGWVNRRHHCRLCGRIFCYSCCNNYAMSKHTGKKERCCRACFKKSSISPNDSELKAKEQEKSSGLLSTTFSLVYGAMAANETSKPVDDAVFDIITDEEVGQIQQAESDQNESQTEEDSMTNLNSTNNSSTFEESDDLQIAQDAEICLLKSGELTAKDPFTVEDILKFGEAKKELFIKSSAYGIIPITVEKSGLTISWEFSSDPKSISFSVVYQESEETSLDHCKVLIPMTRCSSHKETIRGQVKVRKTGIYILIFDNTFSRFISKKVLYRLTVQQPVVYDGSDFP